MKKKNYILITFCCGLLFFIIQFFSFTFQFINGDTTDALIVVSSSDAGSFGAFMSKYWWSLAGTLLLIGVFVHRITKGPEAMLTLVGALMWVVQIFSLHESQEIIAFLLTYIIGVIGVVLVAVAGFYDVYMIKTQGSDDSTNHK